LLHSSRSGQADSLENRAAGGEVPLKSGGRYRRQPLEIQQVECRRLTGDTGQQGMDLSAVVGLVVEPVRQRGRQLLLDLLGRRNAAVFDGAFDAGLVQPFDKAGDPPVFGIARGAQFTERLEQDRIQPIRRIASPVKRCIQIRSVTSR
jgi:hypothetical protein